MAATCHDAFGAGEGENQGYINVVFVNHKSI